MENLTLYPGGGYKSNMTVTTTEMTGVSAADSAMQILGNNNVLQKEESVQMAEGSKIVGGDVAEAFSNLVKIGDNSTMTTTAMDGNTKSILDQALTIVGANTNNSLALIAGRDANAALADTSNEIAAIGNADALKAWLKTTAGKLTAGAVMIGGAWFLYQNLKKGRK
jgi:hypothetical protein